VLDLVVARTDRVEARVTVLVDGRDQLVGLGIAAEAVDLAGEVPPLDLRTDWLYSTTVLDVWPVVLGSPLVPTPFW